MNIKLKFLLSILISTASLTMVGCVATHGDVGTIYARQSRLEAKVDRISTELKDAKSNSTSSSSDEVNDQLFQIENKLFELEQVISDLNEKVNTITNLQSEINTKDPVSSPTTDTDKPDEIPELSEYEKGYAELVAGEYESARNYFKNFIEQNKNDPKVPEAVFFIADSFYREELYEDAILGYQNLIDRYPNNRNVPLSYLKQGLSLIEIDKMEEARLFLEALIDKYPYSEEADKARKKLKDIEPS